MLIGITLTVPAIAQVVPPSAIGIQAINVPYGTISAAPGTPAGESPSFAPLDSGQPASVVGQHFISEATPPSESYDQLLAQTPSVQDIQPNGPVAQQNYGESIRGFQYSQFNTVFDGIVVPGVPQTAVYFTNHDIGSVSVDRGPGTAATIGDATFGGTVSIKSKAPSPTPSATAYGTLGSYRSSLYGIDLETGAQQSLNGGSLFIDISGAQNGAWLTGTTTVRRNVFAKWKQPAGEHTLITAVAVLDHSYGHTPYGTQLSQIEEFGPRYALSDNPGLTNYFGYNTDHYDTDFEYIRVQSALAGRFALDDTGYTNAYDHHETEGADPNGTTPNLFGTIYVAGNKITADNDVPGTAGHSDFRDWGNILRLSKATGMGTIEAGLWFDYLSASAFKYDIDVSQGLLAYTKKPDVTPFSYDYTSGATTLQPYIQDTVSPTPWLTLIPGVRLSKVTRTLDAAVNRSTRLPADDDETFAAPQPSLEVKFKLAPGWTAYGQIAKGFLAPPITVFSTTELTAINPETTANYQVGTAYHQGPVALGGDLYDINFNNYIASSTIAGTTLFTNQGGAVFRGVEAEATYALLKHLYVYANGSLNDATYDNGATVAQSPRRTGALGATYDRRGVAMANDELFASIVAKYVGPQYGSDTGKVDTVPIKSYNYINLSSAYTLPFLADRMKFGADVFNLANRRGIEGLAGLAGDGVTPLFWTEPGRSVIVSLSVTLAG